MVKKIPVLFTVLYALLATKALAQQNNCYPATSYIDLQINNVKARLQNGGDMWWDLAGNARYRVPKDGGASAVFSSSMWIGGIDDGGQIRVAAQTYRQQGNEFYPGPVPSDSGTSKVICDSWDKHFTVYRSEVENFLDDIQDGTLDNPVGQNLLMWPAKGNPHNSIMGNYEMARFVDINRDGIYNPEDGDYPDFCGDQVVWWVYNDIGNAKKETGSQAMGLEVQVEAFAYKTSNVLNECTFYRYKIINKSLNTYNNTFIGQYVDIDLGYYEDDFVGCDTTSNMGIGYNGSAYDGFGTSDHYGIDPPLIGISFLKSITDSQGHEMGMTRFLFYNNDGSATGNPLKIADYYNYLQGKWKDSSSITKGGNGYGGNSIGHYLYPGNPGNNGEWSECSEGNTPGDRRFLMSSGPFTFMPGETKEYLLAVIWVRPENIYPCPDFAVLRSAHLLVKNFLDSTGCLNIKPSVGINDQVMENKFLEVYPNPAKTVINVASDGNISHIEMFNFAGEMVLEIENINKNKHYLDVSHLPFQIYLLKVTDIHSNIYTRKILLIKD